MNTITIQHPNIPTTLLSIDRIGIIMYFLHHSLKLDGSIAEVGTYKGGVGHYLSEFSTTKKIYLFDTFTGIPMKSDIDSHVIGDFNDSNFDTVKNYFESNKNVKVVQGLFPSSAIGIIDNSENFSFVHIDADQYESTLNAITFFYNKMISGGVIVFDDYGHLAGVDKAINNFFVDKPETPIQSTFMQCFIIKQ